ncbi:MAG TPA: zinc ABC transporter substrate-binding protein, partial [Mobilitalea sp.]|nr:zinc ABC transporter substrate-binding protein [Mobilitalea sp.]
VELADIINIVKKDKIQFLFTEKQYGASVAKRIADETDAKVYVIDSAVTGDGTKDSYLNSMENNIAVIRKALQ